jgi:hypothetical protein
MDGAEVRFRATAALRREADRVAYLARRPAWRREALAGALRPDQASLKAVTAALGRRDWIAAHEHLVQHVLDRPRTFVLHPKDWVARTQAIRSDFPGATADAVRRGDSLLACRFDLLGYRNLSFSNGAHDARIDWHFDPVHQRRTPRVFWSQVPFLDPRYGDHKIVWELNRHQYWLALGRAYWLSGDPRYRHAFVEHFDSWMADNPPLAGMNWASMLELGLRSISWIWALHFFAAPIASGSDRSSWTVDLLLGLDRQLSLVADNLSRFFSPNTHLLGEALALYVAGQALPELRRASHWTSVGRSVLLEQMDRQIHRDGGHAELSTHYHRYTLDFYLLALNVARQTGDHAATPFAEACTTLARFARTMADDNGRLPAIGDDDGGMLFPIAGRSPDDGSDSLQLAAELLDAPELSAGLPAEEVVWMFGRSPSRRRPASWPSAALRETGYFVSRTPRGDHLVVDAGRHGFLNGGHAHADALSVTLTVRGRRLLIDPGTACYTINQAMRDWFRSTEAHNTVIVDGRPQSVPDGPFHWRAVAHSTARDWRSADAFDYFEGVHDGYAPTLHARAILARPGCWIVIDRVSGTGRHRADVHWHLDPAWDARPVGRASVRAEHQDGTTVWIASLADGCEIVRGTPGGSGLGWCAPLYGGVVPTSAVRFSRSGDRMLDVVTVIVDCSEQPTLERLPIIDGSDSTAAVAFSIATSDWKDTVLLTRWADTPATGRSSSAMWAAGGLETNARFVCWRENAVGAGAEVLIDGTVSRLPSLDRDLVAGALP